MKLSGVVLTRNEEKNIERCLKSISFCGEVLVIDDNSTDKTLQIATRMGAKIFKKLLNGDFSEQRNFALNVATGDWILYIDADEQVTPELAESIKNAITSSHVTKAYFLKRRDFFWNKELRYGEIRKVRDWGLIRLVKKGFGKWKHPVHEIYDTKGPTGILSGFLNHYPHQTVKSFLQTVNNYSTIRANELLAQKKSVGISEIIFLPFGKFFINYFVNLGFLDGPSGFVYAFMMSFHSFLVRSKLYQYSVIDEKKS